MKGSLFFLTRLVAVCSVVLSLIDADNFYYREWLLSASLAVFLLVSYIYDRKTNFLSLGYIFYFVVCFLSFNVSAYNYINNRQVQILFDRGVPVPKDYYGLYFSVFVGVSLTILFYLFCTKRLLYLQNKIPINSLDSKKALLFYTLSSAPIYLLFGDKSVIFFIGFFLYSTANLFYYSKNIFSFLNFVLACFILLPFLDKRYVLIQFVFPLIFLIVYYYDVLNKRPNKKSIKLLLLIFLGFFFILGYGVISELYKLNKYWGAEISKDEAINIFSNFDLLSTWIGRQTYRLFQVWIHLGGNIIDHVNDTDFYYGTTYFSQLAASFGWRVVHIPSLSAELVDATYAHVGLFAEGYANFGILGAYFNIIVPFFIIEYFGKKIINKNSLVYFIVLAVSFTKIIFDGGTIKSAIIIIFVNLCIFSFLKRRKRYEKPNAYL